MKIKYVRFELNGTSVFAFIDEKTSRFYEFGASQYWYSKADFRKDFNSHPYHVAGKELSDFLKVIPSFQK